MMRVGTNVGAAECQLLARGCRSKSGEDESAGSAEEQGQRDEAKEEDWGG
jgi:hypothetical protein